MTIDVSDVDIASFTDFPFKYSDCNKYIKLPRWKYKLLGPYNGFTGIERIQCWQLSLWAIRIGAIRTPSICSISGAVGVYGRDIHYHNENYYDPLGPHQIHKNIHRTLHMRFSYPHMWNEVLLRYGNATGETWFKNLPMREVNLAAKLRSKGHNKETMIRDFLKRLPSGSPKPYGKLHTRSDFSADGELIVKK